jgi:hypothetical protein
LRHATGRREGKQSTSFCEQKDGAAPRGAKKLYESGAWVVAHALPHHRTSKKESFYSAPEM